MDGKPRNQEKPDVSGIVCTPAELDALTDAWAAEFARIRDEDILQKLYDEHDATDRNP